MAKREEFSEKETHLYFFYIFKEYINIKFSYLFLFTIIKLQGNMNFKTKLNTNFHAYTPMNNS